MSQGTKGKSKLRGPPPTLFLHPSPGGSHVSIPGPGGVTVPAGGAASHAGAGLGVTAAGAQRSGSHHHSDNAAASAALDTGRSTVQQHALRSAGLGGLPLPLKMRQESTRATDRTDALWAEMQATLEEVELSASGGTRVFGPDHDVKLAELRAAQIALAQAWARSEADEAIETTHFTDGDPRHPRPTGSTGKDAAGAGGDTTAGKPDGAGGITAASGGVRPGSAGIGPERLGAKLEEETEDDIVHARKRREANDRYFHRVNQGVVDVVAKLGDVSVAMRAVEQDSKDIWGENEDDHESISGSNKT